jgi:hypothetical protein
MYYLLAYKIKGRRGTKVKEHLARATLIAEVLYRHFQVGPYQIPLKHLRWYLEVHAERLTLASRYRHWLTVRFIVKALNKWSQWEPLLCGPWGRPQGLMKSNDEKLR